MPHTHEMASRKRRFSAHPSATPIAQPSMSRKRIRHPEPPPSSSAGAVDAGRSKDVGRGCNLTDIILNTLRGSGNGRSMKVKSLRKLVLQSIQCDDDSNKETKKRFKKEVHKLEADGRVTLSEEGVITLAKSERSKSKKQKKDKKKRKKTDADEKSNAIEGVDHDYDAKKKRRKGSEVNPWSRNGYGKGVPRLSKSDGRFSPSEISLVTQSVVKFCASRGVTPSELVSGRICRARFNGAWKKIARVVPHRTVHSVYHVAIREFHPFKRGKWTEEECQKLLELVLQLGNNWAKIQDKIDRSAIDCKRKYREISEEYVKGRWTDSETVLLQSLIRQHLDADPKIGMRELRKKVEREGIEISWSAISTAMKNRSHQSCRRKWNTMTAAKPTRTVDVRHIDEDGRLLSFLATSGARRVSDVPWSSSGYHEGDPLERWGDLVEKYASVDVDMFDRWGDLVEKHASVDVDMFDLPVWQLAKYIGKRKIMESKKAADDAANADEKAADEVKRS